MRRTVTGLLVLIVALAMAACGGTRATAPAAATSEPATDPPTADPTATEHPTAEPLVLSDGRGKQITLTEPAQRIVSLAPSNTEIVFAIGAGDQLVGRDDFSDFPEAALAVPSIGSTYGDLNVEAIVGLQPHVIMAAGITPTEQVQALEQVGLTVFVVENPGAFPELFDNLRLVGRLTGHEGEANDLAVEMEARFQSVVEMAEGVEPVTVFYEVDGTDPTSPWTTGSGTFQQIAIGLAGGENVFADIDGWAQVNLEEVVLRDPSVIVFADGPFVPTTVESLSARPGWGDIRAIQTGEVYAMDTDLLDLPGPRLVEGLEAMARILHPELFDE